MKKLCMAIALLVLSSFMLFSCDDGQEETRQSNSVILSTFSDIYELRTFLYSGFYKAEINRESEYITEGDTSARFIIDGGNPQFMLFTDTEWTSMRDFTMVQAVTLDIFNADDEPHNFWLSLTTREGGSGSSRATYIEKTYELQPGYNDVVYTIERDVASQICDMENVEYFTFRFEGTDEGVYSVYADNFRAYTTDQPVQQLSKEYRENEIIFFDDKVDRYFVSPNTTFVSSASAPALSICRDPRYVKSGTGSLQIDPPIVPGVSADAGVTISGEVIERIDFSEYAAFEFSVMGSGETIPGNVSIRVTDRAGVRAPNVSSIRTDTEYDWTKTIPGMVWITVRVDIAELESIGLDTSSLTTLEIFYRNVASEPGYSLFLDDFVLIAK